MRSNRVLVVDEEHITSNFREGTNRVSGRARERFNSGHLDMNTIKMADVNMEGKECSVRIIGIKYTPSMKSEVYSLRIVLKSNGTYLFSKSKYDCPNRWLFCSDTLALFIFIRLVQVKNT